MRAFRLRLRRVSLASPDPASFRDTSPSSAPENGRAATECAPVPARAGIGIVRARACLPARSTVHQRLSRCWTCFILKFASSDRRNPHPSSVANMARSLSPFFVVTSGAFRSSCAWRSDSQLPTRTPCDPTPLIRAIPDASSGPPCHAIAVAFVKPPGRGSAVYQAMNSSGGKSRHRDQESRLRG